MEPINMIGIIAIASLVFLIAFISLYNHLIRQRNQVQNALGGVDVQLKKRYDLIPNLVALVKQYMQHEQGLLQKLTALRSQATTPQLASGEKTALNKALTESIGKVLINVENYPQLKASQSFVQLQRSLNEAEAQISAARRTYNASVTEYNDAIQTFPNNILAKLMGLRSKEVFKTTASAERQNIHIQRLF